MSFTKDKNTMYIYEQYVRRITIQCLNGINGTLFAYGQTGSGKTFTMFGNFSECIYREKSEKKKQKLDQLDGLISFATKELFESTKKDQFRTF